jgi:hypothetical protein
MIAEKATPEVADTKKAAPLPGHDSVKNSIKTS